MIIGGIGTPLSSGGCGGTNPLEQLLSQLLGGGGGCGGSCGGGGCAGAGANVLNQVAGLGF